jgi:hypothetical protein
VAWAGRAVMAFGSDQQFRLWAKNAASTVYCFFYFGFHLFKSQKIIQTSNFHVNL